LNFDGYHDLAPAFDVVPTLQNSGYWSMAVEAKGAASTIEDALSELGEFGIKHLCALKFVQIVARVVDEWPTHFSQHRVHGAEIGQIQQSNNRSSLRFHRSEFC
jgi:serine/threonine-protein kinase HipA